MSTTEYPPRPRHVRTLIDGWLDGSIDERCWIPVRVIDGPEYAEQRATGGRIAAADAFLTATLDYVYRSLAENDMHLELQEETTWERPLGRPSANGLGWVVPTEDDCDDHEPAGPPAPGASTPASGTTTARTAPPVDHQLAAADAVAVADDIHHLETAGLVELYIADDVQTRVRATNPNRNGA